MRRHLEKIVLAVLLMMTSGAMGLNYVYLSEYETTLRFPGDISRFWWGDTMIGPVHSNDWIATARVAETLPVFYGTVSTTRLSFRPGSPNPAGEFLGGPPLFNAPYVPVPYDLSPIRGMAEARGYLFDEADMRYRIEIIGDTADVFGCPDGLPFDEFSELRVHVPLTMPHRPWLFFEGDVYVRGVMDSVDALLVVGTSRDVHIIDDVMYAGASETGGLPAGCSSRMAFVAGDEILLENTWANGREHCSQGCNVFVTALLYGLWGGLSIEQQNDSWEPYVSPVVPDVRGSFVLIGGLVQRYKGYLHRSNLAGTGYRTRKLIFDERLANWDVLGESNQSDQDTIDFGDVPIGTTAFDTLIIYVGNNFSGGWTVSPFFSSNFYQYAGPFSLPVSFAPPGVGTWYGSLTYYVDGGVHIRPLRGVGVPSGPMLAEPSLYPNPFNSEAKLKFELGNAGEVRAIVYDVLGQETARIADGVFQAGVHSLSVNAQSWASGVYFLRLETPEIRKTMKMLLVR